MRGSREYVSSLPQDANIVGVVNLDMILRPAWDSDADRPKDLDVITLDVPFCAAWVQTFVAAATTYVPSLLIDPYSHYPVIWEASDHGPFITAGHAALGAIENTVEEIWAGDSNIYYHSAEDASNALANNPFSPSGCHVRLRLRGGRREGNGCHVGLGSGAASGPRKVLMCQVPRTDGKPRHGRAGAVSLHFLLCRDAGLDLRPFRW